MIHLIFVTLLTAYIIGNCYLVYCYVLDEQDTPAHYRIKGFKLALTIFIMLCLGLAIVAFFAVRSGRNL